MPIHAARIPANVRTRKRSSAAGLMRSVRRLIPVPARNAENRPAITRRVGFHGRAGRGRSWRFQASPWTARVARIRVQVVQSRA
jgi:hypothetical protein